MADASCCCIKSGIKQLIINAPNELCSNMWCVVTSYNLTVNLNSLIQVEKLLSAHLIIDTVWGALTICS